VPSDLRERLETVIELAPKLRESGVSWIEADGVKLKLTPHIPADAIATIFADAERDAAAAERADENATYGLPPDAQKPGFVRPADLPRKANR
jgi:hypothetical protein